ncbi:conserved hypothetical protein [Talaromyces stipitatus ATCC 10500]|uniref:SWI5-dependent HO expression protein 3 n=1 Tax=Talaromyces stipitatus (strain ATCC 10500 / CBS 375.48 / QM 6759 / NRRL 1006) TaxID=441959 RepID=B8MQJ6_TALSN|nr:uncharacterized protein TSTA_058860 [Talaromyces stipitatus ATCC 10500]EED13398.1 conserved hypothetical protein [Talaromyces stipitatus ATCC 10500]
MKRNALRKKSPADALGIRPWALDNNNSSDAPQLNLPRVETRLEMHQTNGLFDSLTTDRRVVSNPSSSPGEGANGVKSKSSNNDLSSEWTSAVGHASTGKSGRVIHNLQEEIARLTRELSLYRSRAEEAQHINETLKEQIINITERLRNSEQSNETNLASISRKDRKIEDLRTEVQNEKARRLRAEAETAKVNQLMSEEQDGFHRRCAELQEASNYSTSQYEALSKASQREKSDLQRKFKGIKDELASLREQAELKDREQERLDALIDRQNQELETERRRIQEIFTAYDNYKTSRDREFEDLVAKGRRNQANVDAAVASLKETEDKMKWVMHVKKDIPWAE